MGSCTEDIGQTLPQRLLAHAELHQELIEFDHCEQRRWADDLREAAAELVRLTAALKQANDQAEHFERLWYLTNEDAARYAFAKTLEGQVVTMETFKARAAAELDQAIDDAMAEEADAHNERMAGA